MRFTPLSADQRKEAVNAAQRYRAWAEATARARESRGSMVWADTKGHSYLLRSFYNKQGQRRQVSLGRRSVDTERIKSDYERSRSEAEARVAQLRPAMQRQAAVNRAMGLGRVPSLSARIIRAVDDHGLLGAGLRVLGTNALYAYEAAAGVHMDAGLIATDDVDLLLDARAGLSFFETEELAEASLLRLLRRVDRSFERSRQDFSAVNRDGFLVDLIKPVPRPPWRPEDRTLGDDPSDLAAVEVAGLVWHENAAPFEAVAIDDRGEPLRIVTSDPRVFAVHKLWVSKQIDRDPVKRRRDGEQAEAVAALIATQLQHLPFAEADLRMLPKRLVTEAERLFQTAAND